jgi:hypothetical protein
MQVLSINFRTSVARLINSYLENNLLVVVYDNDLE